MRQNQCEGSDILRVFGHLVFCLIIAASANAATKSELLALAERGWNYEYRGSFRRQVPDIPPSHLLAKRMPGRSICLLGDVPHPLTLETLGQFRDLMQGIFGEFGQISAQQLRASDCPKDTSVFIRTYSRRLPVEAFNLDLQSLDRRFGIGMTSQPQDILSPAQAVTFFGKRGQATHILILQPRRRHLTDLQKRYFRSLLIEELYQTYSFGIDVFKTGVGGPYASKLQESFINLLQYSWTSSDYMEGLLSSNPGGLCMFDVMMLHAIRDVPENEDQSQAFIDHVSQNYAKLAKRAEATRLSGFLTGLLDPECEAMEP